MVPVDQFLQAVKSYVGVPTRHRGESRAGVNCEGLIRAALRDCGVDIPAPPQYGTHPHGDKLTAGLEKYCDLINEPKPGALVQVYYGNSPRHLCVVMSVSNGRVETVVHAWGKFKEVRVSPMTMTTHAMWWVREVMRWQ